MIYARFWTSMYRHKHAYMYLYIRFGVYIYMYIYALQGHLRRFLQFQFISHYTYALRHRDITYTTYRVYMELQALLDSMSAFTLLRSYTYLLHITHTHCVAYRANITHTPRCTRTGFRFRLDATTCCQQRVRVRQRDGFYFVYLTN